MNLSDLVGHTIASVDVSRGEGLMRFVHDGGQMVLDTYGDCCSETWFADLTGFDALIGSPVISAEEIELSGPSEPDGRSRQDCDDFYGIVITTAKGRCDIVYRNSSNGYYGGGCSFGYELPPGMVMTPITDDWSA